MMIKNTLVHSTALLASCAIPMGLFIGMTALTPFSGAAAFTTALCWIGGFIGFPILLGGLFGLLLLQVVIYLVVSILMHLSLAWMPV
jgi:hypothetical protein